MAEGVLFDFVGAIILKLGSLALHKLESLLGVKEEFAKLYSTFSTIQSVLLDAEKQQSGSHAVKDWLGKLKEAAYDADDLIDEFSYEALRREVITRDKRGKQVRIFFSKHNQIAFGLKISHKIKKGRERLDAISADRTQFHLTEHHKETVDDLIREREYTHSFVGEEEVIGRDDEKQKIVDLLLELDSNVKDNVSVVSIVGIGGLGKTTLAQYVYNDEKVKQNFELRMWVCVSGLFDVKIIVEKIIESATKQRPRNFEMDTLQSQLRGEIEGKKYLLVMDDVWNNNQEKWFNLKKLLMGGARGSKILITTRAKLVALTAETTSMFTLEGLSEKDSWILFKQKAFREGKEPEGQKLVEVGKEIVKRCMGVPLVIRSVGRVLYFKTSESEWLSFKDSELPIITQQENEIMSILKLSYTHLPPYLKQCFAYCSLFPKDYQINKDELIMLWVAQGFIQSPTGGKRAEDVGHDYFMELWWRSFFQDSIRDEHEGILGCQMHDLLHDLAQLVAGSECVLGNLESNRFHERTRHVSFGYELNSSWKLPTSLLSASKLRTFLLPLHSFINQDKMNEYVLDEIISRCVCLRVLDLKGLKFKIVPNSIGKLKHLRYLNLSGNEDIQLLPSSITKLLNLQTLKLSRCFSLKELPRDTKNMINLRHLDIKKCKSLTYMPPGLGSLTSLNTLSLFILSKKDDLISGKSSGISELNGLNSLRGDLSIRGLEQLRVVEFESEAILANLKEKQGLRKLKLRWNLAEDDCEAAPIGKAVHNDETILQHLQPHSNVRELSIVGFNGVKLSGWLSSLSNLIEISFVDCKRLQHLPRLDQLLSLKYLCLQGLSPIEYIDNNDYKGDDSFSSSVFFPSLIMLSLKNMPNLRGWWKRKVPAEGPQQHLLPPSFPKLSSLDISNCPKLDSMPLHPPLSHLLLDNISVQMLELSMITTATSLDTSSPTYFRLSRLNFLFLCQIGDLEFLPEELLRNLKSLEFLRIEECHNLGMSLSRVVQYLTSLHYLFIATCRQLDVFTDEDDGGIQWKGLKSLRQLTLMEIPKLVSLPKGLQYITTLWFLEISSCPNLVTLPEWIGNLTSLSHLAIVNCPKITLLPEEIRHLKSLRELRIVGCTGLDERCKQRGEDWPKIAHVPKIRRDLYLHERTLAETGSSEPEKKILNLFRGFRLGKGPSQ